jgi:N12 class adenine-specific DNA methylase
MSVIKLSKNDITRNDDNSKIKLKKSDLYIDSAMVSSWEASNKQSIGILNDYEKRINKGEWLDEEDRKTYKSAIDTYIKTSTSLRGIGKTLGEGYSDEDEKKWMEGIASINKGYDEISKHYSQFVNETEYTHWYNKNKKAQEYESTLSAPDFAEFSQKGAGVANPAWNDAHAPVSILGWTPFGDGKDIGNMVTFAEANKNQGISSSAQSMRGGGSSSEYSEIINLINTHMKDDEKAIYNYYVGKGETEKAKEYLEYITDVLRERAGGAIAEKVNGTAGEAIMSGIAGVGSWISGMGNIDNYITGKEADPTTALQYAHEKWSKDNEGVWKGFNDLMYTTGNMAPSILISTIPYIGSVAGKVSFGASAVGNAYSEMRNLGYNEWQSRGYSTLVGASEVVLESLLGGISALGGSKSLSTAITKLVGHFDNALAKLAIKVPLSMGSEALEEGIQTVLEPCFKWLTTGRENFESPKWEEILYSSLLGALSAGTIEGIRGTIGAVGSMKTANEYKSIYGQSAYDLVAEALEIDPENKHAQRMQAKLDGGKELSGYNIAHLVESNETEIVNQERTNEQAIKDRDIAKIKSAVEKRLTELGESGDISNLAGIITKAQAGETLTRSEKAMLKNSQYAQRVSNELDPENISSEEYTSDWTGKIGTSRIHADVYGRSIDEESVVEAEQAEAVSATENAPVKENAPTDVISTPDMDVSESAEMTDIPEAEHFPESTEMVSESADAEEVSAENGSVTLEEASVKYGAQAQAMVHTYQEGQDVEKYDSAYQMAYDMGKSGVSLSYVMQSKSTAYLTKQQRELAYEAGQAAAGTAAKARHEKNMASATGKTGRKKGAVKGEGVTIEDLKKTFNDTQNRAYKILSTFAEATGIDIVLYKSGTNANGDFEGAQGKFNPADDKIYIDINAGLKNVKDVDELAKYAMLRTFSHEFTHFLEKYNPEWYNEFRKVVFETLTSRGEDVVDLIETKQAQTPGMDYDRASREVVAEAMTDILPDSQFIETLANKHKNIFDKLLEKLKEFLADLKEYFKTIGHNPSREANALKEQVGEAVHYVENIVKMFDEGAVAAVENYQMTVATEEKIETVEEKTESTVTDSADKNANKEPETEEYDHFSITKNDEFGSFEIKFDGKPSEEIRDVLKAHKYRWHNKKGVWYGKEDIAKDLEAAYNADPYGLTDDEAGAILSYKSGGSYLLNAKLREGIELDEYEQQLVSGIDKALEKLPAYKGKVYRNIQFDGFGDQAARDEYIKSHVAGDIISYGAYTSASTVTDGYLLEGDYVVRHVIESVNGKDLEGYGNNNESEVLFSRDVDFITDRVEYDANGTPTIYLTEVAHGQEYRKQSEESVSGHDQRESQSADTEADTGEVQRLQAQGTENSELQSSVSERNPEGDHAQPEGLQEVREEISASSDGLVIKPKETVSKQGEPSIEEREKAFKRKFAFLNKAGQVGVLHHGDVSLLTDGALAIRATKDEINFAHIEYSGTVTERNTKGTPLEKIIDNANKQLTEAPLQGVSGGMDVYVFNVDGKHAVFNKKLVSKLDGNILYIGDFAKGTHVLKAVDLDGNVAGFLLGMKTKGEVTDAEPSKLKSFSSKFLSQIATKEEKPDVAENVDNRETVRQPDTDRQGDSPVLEGLQAEDVSGNAQSGDSVGDSVERGQETRRDGDSSDHGTGTRGGSGDGDRQSGDLRRDDDVTPEEAAEKAEQLHEEVAEQIEQKSTETPKGKNFAIGDKLSLPNGEKARYKANVEAIRLVKKLEAEGRYATEAEQDILSKYVGWGGIANAFDDRKSDWSKEYNELKELLTEEEYKAARGSTLNAHYTEISVIKAMYDGLNQLGFNGGRMMEPSAGVGNFVGAMPAEMSAKVKSWTMVELDNITGLIAKYLYPNADVRIQGFEKANIPNNYMDVIISNVPFGNYPINDKAYPKKVTSAIHNYFFAKSLDKVRPGGIVMFITSSYTMNSKDETVRRYIMQKADLLGAIRLPDTAFKGNAGTEVVTDIIILKKRADGTPYAGEDFLSSPWGYPVKNNYNGAYINSYFTSHPEMVLGTPSMEGGMYRSGSLTYKALEGKGSLADQIREAFSHINGKMDYPAKPSPEKANFAAERASKKTKKDGYVANDGKIYQNKDGELVEQSLNPKVAERIKGMLEIRDAQKALMTAQQQGLKESEIKGARKKLNALYDDFVKKNGFLNAPANKNAFSADPDRYSLLALENWNPDTKKATKSDIFSKNTISQNRTVTSAKDVSEGLIVSVNQTGGVDTALIAKLTGKTAEDVQRELIDTGKAFKNRDGVLETAETYLSGNVRAKLRDAEALVPIDSDYQKNVDALKTVMPKDVSYQDIFVNPGTPWIPNSVYSDFAAYMLGGRNNEFSQDVDITRNAQTGNFVIDLKNFRLKINSQNTQKWGTPRRSFIDLLDAMLNSKSVVIKDKLDDGSYVINKDATAAANEKIENITKEFQEWLWKDEARRTELATLYNETFNSIVTPKYNGDNLTVNGANALKPLRPHQRNAVQRVISSGGNTLLAHKVGAGKTYEMAAAAMKLKELGLVKKPMFAVPKSLVAQWGNEFIDFFPAAKLLVAEASDFTPANRKVFMNRVANGDYDAVIVSYEQFEKLPVSDDFARGLYQEQVDSIIAAIEEAKAEKGAKALSIKDLEKKRKSLQAKIDKLTDKAKDEDNIDFEGLGVDSLFIDEAHNFKNLFYTTSMTNVAGLGNKDGAKRSFDLYTKVRYLQKLNGGKGIVFATATPVMNSMSEMYIMQKYLQPDLLEQLGLNTFDAWAKQFGEVVNGVEIKPSGQGYRVKQSFSRFKNMSELQLLFRNFADVLTDIPGLKIPKMKGGKVNVVVCEPGQFQKDYMKELEKRADNIKNVDPSVDNMLKITSDGRKISYTQRMIEPTLPYEEGCKIYRCADNVVRAYNESKDIKGTQLIFCDMATPKGKSKTESSETDDSSMDMESAQLYDDIRARLIKGGISAKEIAFIHEADTDQKKKKLFADVNDGKVRVLIGSTGKMGVGMNAQKRVVAIHHLDAPWRPGDVEQRNGRAFRQGNINDEVECFTYVTEGSFDARLWDILERKQNFINQVMNGESVGREAEDTGEVTLSAAEVKALASGSPLIMEQVQLDTDIKKLESLYRAHLSAERAAKERLLNDKVKIEAYEKLISNGKADVRATKDTYSEGKFSITIGKHKFTDKKEAGVALMAEAIAKAVEEKFVSIGSFAGFEVSVLKTKEGIKGHIAGKQSYPFNTYPNNTTRMIGHMISVVEGIPGTVEAWETSLKETKKDMAEQEKLINEPFAKQSELDAKRKRYNEVMEILNPKEEQSLDSSDDDVQEQSRDYLDDEQYQQRTNTLTDREILEMASNEIKVSDLNQAEQDALSIFQNRLSKLKDLQDKRVEQGRLYKEQQFGPKPDRAEAEKTLNRMHTLDDQIKKATADMLTVEEKEVLKRVLSKARKVVEAQERQRGKEILDRWRDRRNNAAAIKKYRDRLRGDVDELSNWILKPDNKDIVKHVPDVLKNTVIPFLGSINFMSKRSLKGGNATASDKEFVRRLASLKAAIKTNIDIQGMYSGYNDLPSDFMDRLDMFIKSASDLVEKAQGEFIINQMTSEELKELSQIVRTLKKYIIQLNRFHNNAMYRHVYEAGDNSIDELKQLSNAGAKTGSLSNALFWQQIRPSYAFERFGDGGKAIYDELREGQAKLAFNTKEIESFSKKAYTEKEVKAWENDIREFTFGGDTVKIPVSYIMSFYELYQDKDGRRHIEGDGIRVATYKKNGKKISDVGHILTKGDIEELIRFVEENPRINEVADSLQKYMAEQGGKWGNYVSVARFGEEKFTNPNYFPINSDGRHLSATVEEHPSAAALYALLNMSFTKARNEEANNRVVIYSIFDVFANHMASMAQYNAMALPILDALKWFNYQQVFIDDDGNKFVMGNLREQMARVYGVPEENKPGSGKQGYAETFIVNIIKAFNGTAAQGTPYDSLGLKSLHKYNMAQVAYNARVALQQPMAITRAGMLIDYRSILKGMKFNPAAIKKNIEEMQKYSGIAAWKSLGFYDVNISRGLTHIIKHDSSALEKIGDVGMWGAEKMDTLTWAAMWSACKEEVTKKKHLTPSSEGFYDEVTKLFEDVIYKTQVVDSILTKNEFMRDKGAFARLVGSFMSEATTNASMLLNAVDKYNLDMKRGMTRQQAWQKNGKLIGRTFYVYSVGAVLLAAMQAVADAWRDDDEYEEYGEKWVNEFVGNLIDELMPFNKLPIISDFYDLAKSLLSAMGVDTYGNPPQSVFMQWYDSLVKGTEIIYDKITGENTNYTWYGGIYKLLQAVSGMSGLPMASATREVISAWNNTVGAFAPSLRIVTYESTQTETRNALYEAILAGDEKEVARIEAKYEDQKDINAAIRKALRENDPRIKEAAEAIVDGKGAIYSKLLDEIKKEGKFSHELIQGAIAAEYEAIMEKKKKSGK